MIAAGILIAALDPGKVQHHAGYRLGVQAYDAIDEVTTIASSIEGGVRIYGPIGVEGTFPFVHVIPSLTTKLGGGAPAWLLGNPSVRFAYADRFATLALRLTTGLAVPLARPDGAFDARLERTGLASAAARSGEWDRWQWAPRTTTWMTSVRIEQAFGILDLGLDAHFLLLAGAGVRAAGRVGGDAAVRFLDDHVEAGVRVHGSGVGMRSTDICPPIGPFVDRDRELICHSVDLDPDPFEDPGFVVSLAPWVGATYAVFEAAARVTVALSGDRSPSAPGGPFVGFDLYVGVAFE